MAAKVIWTFKRNSLWQIIPGLLAYNLIGRHLLYHRACRAWAAEGHDRALIPYPKWLPIRTVATWPKD